MTAFRNSPVIKQCDDSVESTWATLRDSLLEALMRLAKMDETARDVVVE